MNETEEKKGELDPRQKFFIFYTHKFSEELKKSLEGFTPEEEIHITNVLLAMLECYRETPVNYKKAQKITEEMLLKYRKRLLNFTRYRIPDYFGEKTLKQIQLHNEMSQTDTVLDTELFTEEERLEFLNRAENFLLMKKQWLLVYTEPPAENQQHEAKEPQTDGIKTTGIKRGRNDGLTRLNQEQTTLLIRYLQEAKIILPQDFIDDTVSAQAFSSLTGYTYDTIRTSLGKKKLKKIANSTNRNKLYNALTSLTLLIEKDLKAKKSS